ncbi:MAG: bifunctional (p)ppGpp synthetase/guanosine-3',5'-bis(diphosphate) 3'-pyrophosphohydrolase [Chloroflexi bacterium]|nr:bifunctional (p)ppGpp synthetase/guanosine-3',5'-bis(diphosphate) 3'-pyrophosphohydrolase [Chloroflexota bacterium]
MNDVHLLLKAARFSAEKHRDQRRKDSHASPYINHPLQVAEALASIGGVQDVSLLVAALLHDTVEDTGTRPEEIEAEFGAEVLFLVMEVTDDKGLPKPERKRLQVEHAPHKSHRAKQLKLADKICNVNDILNTPPADWSLQRRREYLLWTEQVVEGLRGANPGLERRYDELLAEGKQALGL